MYEYRAQVVRVVDGDTVHADVDLGCDAHIFLTLRLAGINAPEKGTPEGVAALEHLKEILGNGKVTLKTHKDKREKYGRYLADLFTDGVTGGISVNDMMVEDGFAVPYSGGKRGT